MKKNYTALLLALTLTMSIMGCGKKTVPEMPEPEQTARAIEVMTLSNTSIASEYTYSGKVAPNQEANVLSTVGGKVSQANYDIGQNVSKGAVMFRMDTADVENQINVLRASLTAVEAGITSAKTNLELVNGATMQSQIESAKTALENAKLNLDNVTTNYENNKVLFEAGILSETEMNQIQLSYDSAEVAYNQAEQNYDLVANQMPAENQRKAEDAYNSAVAQKASIEAQIKSAQKTISDATVTAPISGVITTKNIVSGTVLSQASPAYVITDMSKVKIDVAVTQQVINTLSVGQQVDVVLSAISQEPFKATITTINPVANVQGTYDVQVELNNSDGVLKVGMLAEVSFTKESAENTIVLPRSCVIEKDNEIYVYIEENGKAKKVLVTTGIDTGENIQITSGLEEGMNVVTRGQTYLNDGDAVQIAFDDSTEDNIDTDNAIDSTTDTEQQYTIPQKENSAESASQKEE
ncbi:MAG: efflux RND transporter periplasmic adaptor subunit [Firmicutes bacterium]|nr:efflux RND transporter periplasmic adaptor subunit [Bacillota bacterium]